MLNKGRMVVAGIICILLLAGCGKDEADWGDRPSYIVTTDTISVIYVLDDTGAVVASITPLQGDSMQGIWSPTLIKGSEKLAFLSRERPSYPPQLYITDRSGKDLTPYGVASPSWLDGSPTAPELIFTVSERISILDVEKEKISSLFSDTSVESDTVGHISFTKTMAPAFSPDGEVIAFINQGTYEEETPAGKVPVPRADLGLVQREGGNYRLLTGAIDDPLPSTGNWLAICWSHDGRWIFAVKKSDGNLGTIYAIRYDETQPDVPIVPIQKDWFKSYSYITASPTGDTLLLGTAPRHADLYVWEFREEAGIIIPGSVVSGRLTTAEVFADPDWGPGAE